MREIFPIMYPSIPLAQSRTGIAVSNPFLRGSEERHQTLDIRVKPQLPENGMVDGYIKIQFSRLSDEDLHSSSSTFNSLPLSPHSPSPWLDERPPEHVQIPTMPPNFATGMKLDAIDRKLLSFRKFHIDTHPTSCSIPHCSFPYTQTCTPIVPAGCYSPTITGARRLSRWQ